MNSIGEYIMKKTRLQEILSAFGILTGIFGLIVSVTSCASKNKSREMPSVSNMNPTKEQAYIKVQNFFKGSLPYEFVLVPEGEFVGVFNPEVKTWIEKRWDTQYVGQLRKRLEPTTHIDLTARGFVKAANRDLGDGQKDETNYDAIWVRDSAWVFWNFYETGKTEQAKKLVLALWDYYATAAQLKRLENVIKNPALVKNKMEIPHIRFNGASPTLDDVYENGKPQMWNHLQLDAHGLFVMSVLASIKSGLIEQKDFTESRVKALALLPEFFSAVRYWNLEDAGAWEEVDRRNSSSIAIVSRSMLQFSDLQKSHKSMFALVQKQASNSEKSFSGLLKDLSQKGLATVREQIQYGGESPVYDIYKSPNFFRRSDAALFNLIVPEPLPGLSEHELRTVMLQLEALKRPFGILRYQNDSYQSGNFWIQVPGAEKKEGTVGTADDTSSENDFKIRLAALIPQTEAQWFFDTYLAMARLELYHLAVKRNDKIQAKQDLISAQLYVKRALGQITGTMDQRTLLAADGLPVKNFLTPESINTLVIEGKNLYLPSPIVPLNWAKASLDMVLYRLEKVMAAEKK
jgi:hypothetical protein